MCSFTTEDLEEKVRKLEKIIKNHERRIQILEHRLGIDRSVPHREFLQEVSHLQDELDKLKDDEIKTD